MSRTEFPVAVKRAASERSGGRCGVNETPEMLEACARLLSLDIETGELTWKVERPAVRCGTRAGTKSSTGYWIVSVENARHQAHRLVFALYHGRWPDGLIDHANGDRLDNRPGNLRECEHWQNTANMSALRSDNTSGHTGVNWNKRERRWTARITVRGKDIFLGGYSEKNDAVTARQAAEAKYFRAFAPKNGGVNA